MGESARRRALAFALLLLSVFSVSAAAQTINVATEAELRAALTSAPAVIVFTADITLTAELPTVATNMTIDGNGHTLSGDNQYRGLVIVAFPAASANPAPVSVAIQDLTIANTIATGGAGGAGVAGGGGGAGLGGAIFVADQATVSLTNVAVVSSSAVGGAGGVGGAGVNGGGGGGMGGAGGANGGGGGGFGLTATGGGNPGGAGIATGGADAGFSGAAAAGGATGGGGGGGGGAGGGGVAGGAGLSGFGGNGGYGGGGGGDAAGSGGFGGFGGGGGGGTLAGGGAGGYGGGGGGTTAAGAAAGGFGGGAGANGAGGAGGGGGAGLGGAIFVQSGGSITVNGLTVNGSSVTAGGGANGGAAGSAYGAGLFLAGNGTINFSPGAGTTVTVADPIADELGAAGGAGSWSLDKNGAGTLVLGGANAFTGGVTVNAGTLSVASQSNLGSGALVLQNASTLSITGSDTFTSDVSVYNTPTINVASGQTATWTGQLSDDGSGTVLGVTGGGTLVLANALNDWLGGTVVTGGSTVAVTADGGLGNAAAGLTLGDAATSGTLAVTGGSFGSARAVALGLGGGVFDVQAASTLTLTGVVLGAGSLTKTGAGTLALAGANTYTGATSVGAGVLQAGAANVFGVNSAVTVAGGATLDLNGFNQTLGSLAGAGSVTLGAAALTTGGDNTSTAFSGVIGGTGSLVKTGAGAFTLSGANTYSGGTTVNGGSLIGTTASLQGAIVNNALVEFNQGAAGTYAGAMSGTGSLLKTGAGALTLTGANSYTGGTTVTGGSLIGNSTSLQGNILSSTLVEFNQGAAGAYAGALSGAGSLLKTGAGTLTLTGANTYTGTTTIAGGVLQAGAAGVFGVNSAVTVAGGTTLALNGFNQTLGSLAGAGNVTLGSAVLTAGGNNASTLVSGAISGSGSLVKTGTGTLTLTGANTYTGGTTVAGGSLVGNTVSLQGNILNNALVTFDQLVDGTYAGSMSGTGGLVKEGAGTLTLAGTNTYTGGTTINAGSIIGNAASLPGNIVNNASLTFDQTTSGTYAGVISGTGTFVKSGSGSLTLTGANSYTGGTLVVGGGALIGNSASLPGNIVNNATVIFDQTSSGTYGGAISGTGSLTLTGGGALTMTGANTYSGGTTVSAGTLIGTTTSLQGDILNNASVIFDQASSGTYAGAMSGTGSLLKTGSGSLTLTGANSYTGGTTVDGGSLVGTSTSLQGNIVNNALVIFDQASSGTYAGTMSGTGALLKTGVGALTLTGANSHTGGTTVSGGSLVGNSTSLQGAIVSNAQLVFDQSTNGSFNGVLGGAGGITKTGAGTLTLVGNQPFSGGLAVSQGTLVVDGIFGGSVTVAPGATFQASGTVLGGLNVAGSLSATAPSSGAAARSLLWAGPSSAVTSGGASLLATQPILTVGGDLNAPPGSVLAFPVSEGPVPSIVVGGIATLVGSHLDLTAADIGNRRSVSVLALTAANGLHVADTDASTQNPLLVPAFSQDGSSLYITLLNLGVPLAGGVTNPNAVSVGRAIDRMKAGATGDQATVIRELTALDGGALDEALQSAAGEIHASSLYLALADGAAFSDLLRDQLTARNHDREAGQTGWGGDRVQWWTQFTGSHGTLKPVGGAHGGTVDMGGGAGGMDWRLSDRWLVGGGGGFGKGKMGLGGLGASSDFQAPRAFGYVGFRPRGFGLSVGGSASRTRTDVVRRLVFAATLPAELGGARLFDGIDRTAEVIERSTVSDAWSEYSDDIEIKSYTLDWMAGIRRIKVSRDSFTETGAGALSLAGPVQAVSFKQTDVKVHLWRHEGWARPFVETLFRWELTKGRTVTGLQFAGAPGTEFDVEGLPAPQDTFVGRGGVTLMTRLGALTFDYQLRHAPGQTHQTVDVRFRFR